MRLNIKTKITAGLLFISLVPLGMFWGAHYKIGANQTVGSVRTQLEEYSSRSVQKLDDWIVTNDKVLKTVSEIPGLSLMPISEKKELMNAFANKYPWIRAIFYADDKGQQIARSDAAALVKVGDRDYFKEAMSGKFGKQLIVSRVTGKAGLQLAQGVKEKDKIVGIVSSAIDLGPISEKIVSEKIGKTGYRFILSAEGNLIGHIDEKELFKGGEGKLTSYSSHPLWSVKNESSSSFKKFELEGQKWFGVIEPSKVGWYVATVISEKEAIGSDMSNLSEDYRLLTLLAISFVFVSGVMFVFANELSRPIVKIKDIMVDFTKHLDDKDEQLATIRTKDEVGDFVSSLRKYTAAARNIIRGAR